MKRMTKGTAFWAAYFGILAVYFVTLFVAKDVAIAIAPAIVASLTAAGGIYQVANVADNGVKGKFYKSELDK